jgi:hypothetical protein
VRDLFDAYRARFHRLDADLGFLLHNSNTDFFAAVQLALGRCLSC